MAKPERGKPDLIKALLRLLRREGYGLAFIKFEKTESGEVPVFNVYYKDKNLGILEMKPEAFYDKFKMVEKDEGMSPGYAEQMMRDVLELMGIPKEEWPQYMGGATTA